MNEPKTTTPDMFFMREQHYKAKKTHRYEYSVIFVIKGIYKRKCWSCFNRRVILILAKEHCIVRSTWDYCGSTVITRRPALILQHVFFTSSAGKWARLIHTSDSHYRIDNHSIAFHIYTWIYYPQCEGGNIEIFSWGTSWSDKNEDKCCFNLLASWLMGLMKLGVPKMLQMSSIHLLFTSWASPIHPTLFKWLQSLILLK